MDVRTALALTDRMSALDPRHKLLLNLTLVERLSPREIAYVTGEPESRVARDLVQLQHAFEQ